MQHESRPDEQTFTTAFMTCGKIQNPQSAKDVYDAWLESKIPFSEYSMTSCISMFVKCNMMDLAKQASLQFCFYYLLAIYF